MSKLTYTCQIFTYVCQHIYVQISNNRDTYICTNVTYKCHKLTYKCHEFTYVVQNHTISDDVTDTCELGDTNM